MRTPKCQRYPCSLLRELDHGPAALPRGSEVVLFNQHGPPQEMAQRADIANMDNVRITHVRGNPSNRRDLAQKINIPTCVLFATVSFFLKQSCVAVASPSVTHRIKGFRGSGRGMLWRCRCQIVCRSHLDSIIQRLALRRDM